MSFFQGDFQYKNTRIEADEIYNNSKDELRENATVFIATDHQGKPFFQPLADHYDLVFLNDFKDILKDVNTNCEYTFLLIAEFSYCNLNHHSYFVAKTCCRFWYDRPVSCKQRSRFLRLLLFDVLWIRLSLAWISRAKR